MEITCRVGEVTSHDRAEIIYKLHDTEARLTLDMSKDRHNLGRTHASDLMRSALRQVVMVAQAHQAPRIHEPRAGLGVGGRRRVLARAFHMEVQPAARALSLVVVACVSQPVLVSRCAGVVLWMSIAEEPPERRYVFGRFFGAWVNTFLLGGFRAFYSSSISLLNVGRCHSRCRAKS